MKARLVRCCALLALLMPGVAAAEDGATFATGVAISPRNFPHHSAADLDDAFHLAHGLGGHAVFIHQWSSQNPTTTRLLVEKARNLGMATVVGLSPTSLDRGRKELDLPSSVRRAAGRPLSFANPAIRKAFIAAATDMAALRPDYLCLATEINLLGLQRLDEYLQFASLYKEAYRAVKQVSPETRVFVSFQWEWMRILDERDPAGVNEHRKLIDVFRPELDVVGLTTYPAPIHKRVADLPEDYYRSIARHLDPDDRLLFMEVGWPSAGIGSEAGQAEFIHRLPALLRGMKIELVAWALLHDVAMSEFDDNLNSVGLLRRNGEKKPAFAIFRDMSKH